MFSSRTFMVSGLMLKFVIYFELIFVYVVKRVAHFGLFLCDCPLFPAPFIEETVFSPSFIFIFFIEH